MILDFIALITLLCQCALRVALKVFLVISTDFIMFSAFSHASETEFLSCVRINEQNKSSVDPKLHKKGQKKKPEESHR